MHPSRWRRRPAASDGAVATAVRAVPSSTLAKCGKLTRGDQRGPSSPIDRPSLWLRVGPTLWRRDALAGGCETGTCAGAPSSDEPSDDPARCVAMGGVTRSMTPVLTVRPEADG